MEGYQLTDTEAVLNHYLGNSLWTAIIAQHPIYGKRYDNSAVDREKMTFIKELQEAIDRQVPVSGNVTYEALTRMIEAAQGDWSDKSTLETLYKMGCELTKRDPRVFENWLYRDG